MGERGKMKRVTKAEDDNAPSRFRLQHGDVASYTPRDFGDSKRAELAPQFESRASRRRDEPLKMLAHLLGPEDRFAASVFARAYERTLPTVAAVNWEFTGSRGGDGLTAARCRALGEFGALCMAVETDPDLRLRRCKLLVLVLGQGRTLSSLFPQKGRDFATAKHMLISSIQRIARHLEIARNADDHNPGRNVEAPASEDEGRT
jgi:hypothetical protein